MGFSKISADADFGGGVWHILPSGEHREWSPLGCLLKMWSGLDWYFVWFRLVLCFECTFFIFDCGVILLLLFIFVVNRPNTYSLHLTRYARIMWAWSRAALSASRRAPFTFSLVACLQTHVALRVDLDYVLSIPGTRITGIKSKNVESLSPILHIKWYLNPQKSKQVKWALNHRFTTS